MTMTTPLFQRLSLLILGCAATLLLMGSGTPLYAQSVAVMVNGEPITNYDIEQRSKLNFLSTHKPPPRQEVIDELIDEKVKIKEAKQFGIDPSVSDIDASFAQMSSRMRHHARPTHQISRKPGHSTRHAEGSHEGRDGLGQPGPRPLQGEPPGRREGSRRRRRRPAQGRRQGREDGDRELRIQDAADRPDRAERIARRPSSRPGARKPKPCAAACRPATRPTRFFKSMQNAAIREAVTKTSADIPAVLREVLDKTPIGHLTEPEVTKQGVEMVALCGTEADHRRHAAEKGNPRQDVCREIRGEVESLSGRKSAKPR